MVRFVHSADWQLGMTRREYLGAEAQPRFVAARIEAVATIGRLARDQRCPFVVVAGDVFESNHVERQIVVRALEAMAATPEVTFHLLPGNHDPLDAASVFRSATFVEHRPANVHVLTGEVVEVAPGVELVPVPWTTKRPLQDLLGARLSELEADGTVRIVVAHGRVDHLTPDEADPALIRSAALEAAVADGRVHYVALGDKHSTRSVGPSGRVWYSGAPEATDFREPDPGNVLLVSLDPATGQVGVNPRHVGTWAFVRHEAELTGEADLRVLDTFLDGLPQKTRTIVRLSLRGQLSLSERAALDTLLAHYADLFATLHGWERRIDLMLLPDDTDFAGLELSGFAGAALADLRDLATGTDAQAVTARDALALLYRLGGAPS
jgi:DNA repair exonuclease SbcCD nuclease subunit